MYCFNDLSCNRELSNGQGDLHHRQLVFLQTTCSRQLLCHKMTIYQKYYELLWKFNRSNATITVSTNNSKKIVNVVEAATFIYHVVIVPK